MVPKPPPSLPENNADWTFVILFDQNFKIKFSSLEAVVSTSKFGKAVTFVPKPFLKHGEDDLLIFNALAEGVNWENLGNRDCK